MNPTPDKNRQVLQSVTARFLKVMDYILERPKVFEIDSITAFTDEMEMIREVVYDFRKGKKYVTIPQCNNMCELFAVPADWLYLNKGSWREVEKLMRNKQLNQRKR